MPPYTTRGTDVPRGHGCLCRFPYLLLACNINVFVWLIDRAPISRWITEQCQSLQYRTYRCSDQAAGIAAGLTSASLELNELSMRCVKICLALFSRQRTGRGLVPAPHKGFADHLSRRCNVPVGTGTTGVSEILLSSHGLGSVIRPVMLSNFACSQ